MTKIPNYILLAAIAYISQYYKQPGIILKVINNKEEPIKNIPLMLIGKNFKKWVITNSKGEIYLCNIPYGIYELRIYSNKTTYLYERVKIIGPGCYTVKMNKFSLTEICGNIYDEINKTPIPNAIVILFKYNKNNNSYIPIKKTITNEKGDYSFKNIPCGCYFIKSIK